MLFLISTNDIFLMCHDDVVVKNGSSNIPVTLPVTEVGDA